MNLDRLDIQILNLLQEDASQPLRVLARKVNSSPATCQRRIAILRAELRTRRAVHASVTVTRNRSDPLENQG